jgi:hypothetical protein
MHGIILIGNKKYQSKGQTKMTNQMTPEVAQIIIGVDQEVTRRMALKTVTAPPSFDALFAELSEWQSDAEKAQTIMERNGLDGLELGDDPDFQSTDRTTVYHIIHLLLSRGWTFKRVGEWCTGAKWHCSFTLNGQTVR